MQQMPQEWLKSAPEISSLDTGDLRITGQTGDFVLWHHALPHGSGHHFVPYPRVVQYISVFPHDYGTHPEWK